MQGAGHSLPQRVLLLLENPSMFPGPAARALIYFHRPDSRDSVSSVFFSNYAPLKVWELPQGRLEAEPKGLGGYEVLLCSDLYIGSHLPSIQSLKSLVCVYYRK